MTTVCLCMIVKDEAHVLARCLRSVKRMIHTYVIVDTGSTDETKEVIARELAGIPGIVRDSAWKDFATNRNEALDLARGRATYNLVIDADDELQGAVPSSLTHDFYTLTVTDTIDDRSYSFQRVHLFRNDQPFRYEYVLHEQLVIPRGMVGDHLSRLHYRRNYDGARSQDLKAKWLRDADVCRAAFATAPEGSAASEHYAQYYAQSLQAAGDFAAAIQACRTHVKISTKRNGPLVPRWQSLYRIATMRVSLAGDGDAEIIDSFLRAYECVPQRAEPLYELALYLQDRGRHRLVYTLLKPIVNRPPPAMDGISIEWAVYQYGLKDRLATSAFYVGDTHLARRLCEELLQTSELPDSERPRITAHYEAAVAEIVPEGAPKPDAADHALLPSVEDASALNRAPASPFFGTFLQEMRRQRAPGSGEMALAVSLFALVVSIRARHVLELGRYKGSMTFAIASALKLLVEEAWEEPAWAKRPGKDYVAFEAVGGVRKVVSVDPKPMPEAVELFQKYELRKYATFVDRATVAREDMLAAPDVVVVNHGAPKDALPAAIGMLRPGGYLVVYDVRGADAQGHYLADEVTKVLRWERLEVVSGYRGYVVFRKDEG